jgi:hypothetical protein
MWTALLHVPWLQAHSTQPQQHMAEPFRSHHCCIMAVLPKPGTATPLATHHLPVLQYPGGCTPGPAQLPILIHIPCLRHLCTLFVQAVHSAHRLLDSSGGVITWMQAAETTKCRTLGKHAHKGSMQAPAAVRSGHTCRLPLQLQHLGQCPQQPAPV